MSRNGIGLVLLLLSVIGLEVTEESVTEIISAIGTLISFGLMVYNQYKRPDTELFLWKTKKLDEEL